LNSLNFKVHKALLGADKIIIENIANLDSIPPTGGFVLVLPIKIKDGIEVPVRLVGLIEGNTNSISIAYCVALHDIRCAPI